MATDESLVYSLDYGEYEVSVSLYCEKIDTFNTRVGQVKYQIKEMCSNLTGYIKQLFILGFSTQAE